MNSIENMINNAKNDKYRNDDFVSLLKSDLEILKITYDLLNDECSFYENKKEKSAEDINKLNDLYAQMKVICDKYKSFANLYKEEISKEARNTNAVLGSACSVNTVSEKEMENTGATVSKKKKNGIGAAIVAGLAAIAILIGGFVAKRNKDKDNLPVDSEIQYEDVNVVYSEVTKNINKLNYSQKTAWSKINVFQNYFNNEAAVSIEKEEDNGNRLFLTAEECISLYATINAKDYTAEELADIFGKNSVYFNENNVKDNFKNAMRVLNYYYLTAVESSGVDRLFEDPVDAALFRSYEELVLKYNQDRSKENAKALHDFLMNDLFLNPSLENPKAMNPNVLAIIGMGSAPALYVQGVIDNSELDKIVEIYESIICDELYPRVIEATILEGKTDHQDVLDILPELLNKQNIKVKSRDIKFNVSRQNGASDVITTSKEIVTTSKEVTREEAVEEFGEETVKDAEEEAKKEVESDNASEIEYGKGIDDAINSGIYDEVYDIVSSTGDTPKDINLPTNGNESHDKGVEDASKVIIEHAVEDATVEYEIDQVLPQDDYYVDDASLPDDFALLLK